MRALRALRRSPRGAAQNEASAAALRAAVLLRGGMPASRVWSALGREASGSTELAAIARRAADGGSPAEALAAAGGPQWRVLAAAWEVAELSGAPLAPALERLAAAGRDLDRLAERREVLLSGPRSTVRLVVALPPLALLLGALLGFDPFPVMMSSVGAALAGVGLALLALGSVWSRAIVERVADADRAAGWASELCAISLGGGGPPGESLRRVADCADRARAEWIRLAELRRDGAVRAVLDTAERLGAPAGSLLLGAAESARARTHAELERRAEHLAVRVLVPLGICVLPSFVLLGVMPVLLAMMGGVAG